MLLMQTIIHADSTMFSVLIANFFGSCIISVLHHQQPAVCIWLIRLLPFFQRDFNVPVAKTDFVVSQTFVIQKNLFC